jgi:signal transduction histidine kinase
MRQCSCGPSGANTADGRQATSTDRWMDERSKGGVSVAARAEDPHVWVSSTGWHAAFAFLALVTGTWAVLDGETLLLVPLVVLTCWYAVVGAPVLGREPERRGQIYLAVAWPLTLLLFAMNDLGALMLFALYPHIWRMLDFHRALVGTVAVISTVTAVMIVKAGPGTEEALLLAAITLVIGVLLGWWITRIIEQSRRRAELLLAERERLGLEIHDTLAQGFTSVLMLVRSADRSIESDPATARRHLELAARTAEDNLAESRSLVAVLTRGRENPAPLAEALTRMASAIDAELVVDGSPRILPAEQEVALLRVAREALTNAGKHASASRVTIRLAYRTGRVVLEVEDDGRGFGVSDTPGEGFGLEGMRRRMTQVGGTLGIHSEPGAGTTVTAEVMTG